MLKRMINKKLLITTAALFALFLIYLVPKNNNYTLKKIESVTNYVDLDVATEEVYLLNSHNLLSRTKIVSNCKKSDIQKRAIMAISSLIIDGPNSNLLPNGFKAILPNDTKIISSSIEKNLLKINFSKQLLTIKASDEEKMIEAIIYTATAIDGIDNIIIYVNNDILTLLPKTKTTLPATLNRTFGINKEYKFTKTNDITQVTIYYVDKLKDNYYYVPVTKYLNDERDKVSIIIDELTSTNTFSGNLMSFLNSNTKIINANQVNNAMELNFNSYIFNSEENNILEEVIYTISLSIKDNYNIDEVVFKIDNKEICKSVLKTID